MVNAAQVLEVEEVQRGRGLRVAGGADHGQGGLVDQSRSRTASGWGESNTARRSEREAQKRRSAHHRRSRQGAGNWPVSYTRKPVFNPKLTKDPSTTREQRAV